MKKINLLANLSLFFLLMALCSTAVADEKTWGIQEAVKFAISNNPDSNIGRKRIMIAEAMVKQSLSGYYPQIHLSSQYSQTNNAMYSLGNIFNQGKFDENIDFNDPGRTDNLQLKAEIRYRLYSGGIMQANTNVAIAHILSSELMLTAFHNQLAFEVVKFFHIINQTQDTVDAGESAIEAISASLKVAKARFDAGSLLKQDLLNIELQQSIAEENLIQANHDLALSKRAFLNLLGLTDTTVKVDSTDSNQQQIPKIIDFSNRPENKLVECLIETAREGLKKAQGANRPTVDAFANYQVNSGSVLDGEEDSWMAGLRIDYLLFDGHKTSGAIHAAQAKLLEAQEKKKKVFLEINLEIEKARLALQKAEEKLRVTGKMVDLATESARLSRVRFKEGVVLASELIDVETRLTNALVHRSAADAMRKIAVADLRRAVGLSQFE